MAVTPADAAELLMIAAAFDRRTIGEADAVAWADALHDLDPMMCAAGVRSHYRDTAEWIMPSHIRQRVKALRETAAERAHKQNLRQAIDAPRDQSASHHGYLNAVGTLAAARGLSEYDRGKADAESQARGVRCPFCRAGVGSACSNNGAPKPVK